jgi:2-dehydro-3-deoxyphosphooctonate aldolase (KDO 8-P synthase)
MATTTLQLKDYFRGRMPLIAGPCAVESMEITLKIAQKVAEVGAALDIPVIFKASYKKANRTAVDSFSGIGDEAALEVLAKVKDQVGIPILTDVHEVHELELLREVVDIIQIPAFLCRQTELIMESAATGKPVNIKKGQFASADTMRHAIQKIYATGNEQVMLTERGTFFGYQDLVVDMRNIPLMQANGVPVIYDATHSVQQPGQAKGISGGLKEMITPLCDAAMAAGADGLFIETHPNPKQSRSDAATMLPLEDLQAFVERMLKWWTLRRQL